MATLKVVQTTAITSSAGSQASVTTAGITTTSGNLLIAIVGSFGNHIGATPITDSNGNSWTAAIASTGATKGWGAIFYCANATGGAAHTFTFTPSASDFIVITVFEVGGAATSSVLGNTNSATSAGTTHNSGNITTNSSIVSIMIGACMSSQANEIVTVAQTRAVINGIWSMTGTTIPIGATASTEGMIVGYRIAEPSTTDQFTAVLNHSDNETIMVAEFKAASSGGSGNSGGYGF